MEDTILLILITSFFIISLIIIKFFDSLSRGE